MNAGLARLAVPAQISRSQETILLVEGDEAIGRELVEQLCADRYCVALARTAEHARVYARAQPIRAVLLGGLDSPHGALDLLNEIRGLDRGWAGAPVWEECLPTIVLSQKAEQLEMLRAFEMGADDFIGGECSYLELRARLKSVLRRAEDSQPRRFLRIGSLEIDTHGRTALVAGTPVGLCRLEYELLVHLARDPAGVCSKEELLLAIWHRHRGTGTRTVDSHASRLRGKLETAGAPGLIVNVWGVGYRLT